MYMNYFCAVKLVSSGHYVRQPPSSSLQPCTYVKPGNKNQKLGTLGDFEFVVDYASTISLDIVFKIS